MTAIILQSLTILCSVFCKSSVLHQKTHLAITATKISHWGDLSNTLPYFCNKCHTVTTIVANHHHRALQRKTCPRTHTQNTFQMHNLQNLTNKPMSMDTNMKITEM